MTPTKEHAMSRWTKAKRQAQAIGQTKTAAGRRRSVLTWCQRVKEALR